MIRRLGVDVLAVSDLDRLAGRAWFLRLVYSAAELADAGQMAPRRRREFLAGRFAAKEAVLKVLGTGLLGPVPVREIEILRADGGAPVVTLGGLSADRAAALGLGRIALSIAHKHDAVVAVALGIRALESAEDKEQACPTN